jgi:RecA-family ATPase
MGIWDAGDDLEMPEPRHWLLGNQFCRKFLSGILAPGSTGKTSLRMLQYLSLATGRKLTGQHVFKRSRVLIVSLEDDKDELRRRLKAACIHYNIKPADLKGWLFCAAPKGFKLAEMKNGSRQIGVLEKMLRRAIEKWRPDLTGLDPFIKLHAMEENDNGAMDFVCDLLVQLAIEYDIAVDVPHHTKKGKRRCRRCRRRPRRERSQGRRPTHLHTDPDDGGGGQDLRRQGRGAQPLRPARQRQGQPRAPLRRGDMVQAHWRPARER